MHWLEIVMVNDMDFNSWFCVLQINVLDRADEDLKGKEDEKC